MDQDSPFAHLSKPTPIKGSGGHTVCIIFCNDCYAHWLAPVLSERCIKCQSHKIELLKQYESKAPRV